MKDNIIEKRKEAQYKYGHHAFIILLCLVLTDGLIRAFYDWAYPFTGSIIIAIVACLYFQIKLIFSGVSYIGNNYSASLSANSIFSATSIFMIILVIANFHRKQFISCGRLTDECNQIIMAFYFTVVSIAVWIKFILDKSKSKRDDCNEN